MSGRGSDPDVSKKSPFALHPRLTKGYSPWQFKSVPLSGKKTARHLVRNLRLPARPATPGIPS